MQCEIIYRHPRKENRALPPQVLVFVDQKKEKHFYEPETRKAGDQQITVYTVSEEYARALLSTQPDRFFLLKPASLMVQFKTHHGLATKFDRVTALDLTKPFPAEPARKTKPKEPVIPASAVSGPQGGGEPPASDLPPTSDGQPSSSTAPAAPETTDL